MPDNAHARMRNQQAASAIQGNAVWPAGAAMQLREHTGFANLVTGMHGHAPDLLAARGRYVQQLFLLIPGQAIGAGNAIEQQAEQASFG